MDFSRKNQTSFLNTSSFNFFEKQVVLLCTQKSIFASGSNRLPAFSWV